MYTGEATYPGMYLGRHIYPGTYLGRHIGRYTHPEGPGRLKKEDYTHPEGSWEAKGRELYTP